MKGILTDLKGIAKKIKFPISDWPGNCYAVACAFVNYGIIKGTPRYGHYLGTIHTKSMFYNKSGAGFVRHGWIELPNKCIVDPTRFVFENKKPYIYFGKNDYYDVGGSSMKDMMRASTPVPAFNENDKLVEFNLSKKPLHVLHIICKEQREGNKFTVNQLFWISNANPIEFGKYAKAIYTQIRILNHDAFIPIDYWKLVMGKS